MLVLARKRDQSIVIGDDVEVIIVDVHGDQVKLGITAPRHIPVHRKEIYEEIQRENIRAAQSKAEGLEKLDKMFKKR
ncbi:carbon storage regulator CsrA [bacterium]|nr:carbon storage regulator CsrA [bacterium]MBU1615360.1 carbon storage regulator CsrA [bacterium]